MLKNINIACLVISTIWMVKSNFDFEPIIVTLGLIAALFFSSNLQKRNFIKIKDGNNEIEQENSQTEGFASNEVIIKRGNNKIKQKNN